MKQWIQNCKKKLQNIRSGKPRWFTRPKENRYFFNISLLMGHWIEATAAPLAISYLVSFSVNALYFSSSSVPGNFLFSGLPGIAFLLHFNWNIFMKSYDGNWQINRNTRNRMSEKILSERIPLNGWWNNRTSPTWTLGKILNIFFLYKIDEIKWPSNTGQSVLKSKRFLSDQWSFYRTCPTVFSFHC